MQQDKAVSVFRLLTTSDNNYILCIWANQIIFEHLQNYKIFENVNVNYILVAIMGSRTFDKIQHFSRFTLNIESMNEVGNISPQKVGMFQIFDDNLSKFNEDCVNTISETSTLPKTEVAFLWTAPPAGSGCVTFR